MKKLSIILCLMLLAFSALAFGGCDTGFTDVYCVRYSIGNTNEYIYSVYQMDIKEMTTISYEEDGPFDISNESLLHGNISIDKSNIPDLKEDDILYFMRYGSIRTKVVVNKIQLYYTSVKIIDDSTIEIRYYEKDNDSKYDNNYTFVSKTVTTNSYEITYFN